MFFEKEIISFNILGVYKFSQKESHSNNKGRNFSALSFRFCSDAVLEDSKSKYQMKENCVTYVPARLNYKRNATKDEFIVVHFDTTDHHADRIECFEAKSAERLAQLFKDILDCWDKQKVGYKYRCSGLFYEVLAECYAQNYTQPNQNSKIKRSVDYILKNYKNSNLSIREIADKSFMSEVYFRKIFKKEFGISPQKYIIELRIQYAAGLISTGCFSLTEIAGMSGYNDYKYFSVEFKKIMGVSPSDYQYNFTADWLPKKDT